MPPGLLHWIPEAERARKKMLLGVDWPEEVSAPAAYGHWRSWVVATGYAFPVWLHHCGKPLFLLGKRASQAATQIDAKERLAWLALNCRVTEHAGRKQWRPVLKEADLKDAYPLV